MALKMFNAIHILKRQKWHCLKSFLNLGDFLISFEDLFSKICGLTLCLIDICIFFGGVLHMKSPYSAVKKSRGIGVSTGFWWMLQELGSIKFGGEIYVQKATVITTVYTKNQTPSTHGCGKGDMLVFRIQTPTLEKVDFRRISG